MAKKKTTSLWSQATRLGTSKYAPALEAVAQQQKGNLSLYNTGADQRTSSLSRELGSIQAAGATTNKLLEGLKGSTGNAFQTAIAESQKNSAATQIARNQANSSMLSSLQAEARARGIGSTDSSEFASRLSSQDAVMNSVASMNQGALSRGKQNALLSLTEEQGMSSMMTNTAGSGARGAAQTELDQLYNQYVTQRQALEGENAVKLLEKGDYINQTYLVLKEKAAQEKAAKAQAKAASAIAAGNLAYKNTALKVNTQYKYDALAAKTAQTDIANKLKAEGFSHKRAMDIANMALKQSKYNLDVEKFDWSKLNPGGNTNQKIADIIASIQ